MRIVIQLIIIVVFNLFGYDSFKIQVNTNVNYNKTAAAATAVRKQQPIVIVAKWLNQSLQQQQQQQSHQQQQQQYKCPNECSCQGLSIDCSYRRLTRIPRLIPNNVIKVELQGNKLNAIKNEELSYLKNLKVLHLQDNQIEYIEKNSFENLISLERLRLNNNKLTYLDNELFTNLKSLKRLDLSFNKLKSISKEIFASLSNLNNLQLDNNEIKCMERGSLDQLIKLDIFRIQNNKLECDCKTVWIGNWLNKHPHLAHDTKCYTYDKYKEYDLSKLNEIDFNCAHHQDLTCQTEQMCPYPCNCEGSIVDCKEKSLIQVPASMISESTVELHLKKNGITEIAGEAFSKLKNLRLLDLSNNQIQKLHPDSFKGLVALNTLILFRNEIKYLPPMFLSESSNLQFLLMNANKLTCLDKDTFVGLSHLNLLSLYDNQLKSLPSGLLDPLNSIQTIHLGRNPLICDCKLRWLNEYFRSRPVERSGITCSLPKRLAKKSIGSIPNAKFRCHGTHLNNSVITQSDELCLPAAECPTDCTCSGTVIDCKARNLYQLPSNLPEATTEIHLQDNFIKEIKAKGTFKRLKYLQRIDLRNNKIELIENRAFEGAQALTDLFLNENNLSEIKPDAFFGLNSLKTLLLRTNKISKIQNNTFDHLTSLRLLSLYDNKIKCVQPGSFDRLKSLSTLNLMANPFYCNCHLKWLKDWLRNSNLATGNPKCGLPEKLKDQSITSLDDKDLICLNANEQCDATQSSITPTDKAVNLTVLENCPKNCTCNNLTIRCSHSGLKRIPDEISVNVQELYLDSNELTEIPIQLKKLTNLIKLDLSFNKIRSIPSRIFENMVKLDTLILSYNTIHCIQVDSFVGLGKLRMLSLYSNDVTTIPDGSFSELTSLSHIAIGLNPFYCDCNLAWLSAWIKNDYVEPGIARCQGPSLLANKLILTTPIYYFECPNESKVPENKCDVCYKNNCANNSTCIAKLNSDNSYQCICSPGYHGEKCEQRIDACYGQPCKNQGVCNVLMEGRYKCDCKKGWEGYHCQVNIDECQTNNCKNNATCVDRLGYYECQCAKGYQGVNCEQKIEWCTHSAYNPCENGAKCVRILNNTSYKCECKPGYHGEHCNINTDDCLNHKCQFGTCVDGIQNYTCKCKEGFSGHFCDLMNPIAMPLIGNQKQTVQKIEQAIGCEANDCQNGGICFKMAINGQLEAKTRCKCPLGYSGDKCAVMSLVNFQYEDSYLELESPELDTQFNLTFTILTDAENGVLFYHGSKAKHHMAVELFKGRIRISFDVGNTPSSTMFSYAKVNDKKERTIQLLISGQNFTMKINDNNEQRTISNQGLIQYLNVGDESLYVGGVPNSIKERISKHLLHVRNASSYRGCFINLYINSELKNLQQVEYSHKIKPGCIHLESCSREEQKPKCYNGGTCQTVFSLNSDFNCKCTKDYMGNTCEIPIRHSANRAEPLLINYANQKASPLLLKSDDVITVGVTTGSGQDCSHEFITDFYTDIKTGCKTNRKIKQIVCKGECKQISTDKDPNKQSQMPSFAFLIGTNKKAAAYQRSITTTSLATPTKCCQPIRSRSKKVKLYCPGGSTLITDIHLPKKCVCSTRKKTTTNNGA